MYEISQQSIRLVGLKKEIDDGTYSLQIATDSIIRQHKKIEEEALASQLIAIKAEKAASKMLEIIQEKIDYLNDKYGKNKVLISSQNLYHKSKIDKKRLSPNYLNSWSDMPNINI